MNNHKKSKYRPLWTIMKFQRLQWLGSRNRSRFPVDLKEFSNRQWPGASRWLRPGSLFITLDSSWVYWSEGIAMMAVSCHPQIAVGGSWFYIFELFYISGVLGAIWIIRLLWPGASILRVHNSQSILSFFEYLWYLPSGEWWISQLYLGRTEINEATPVFRWLVLFTHLDMSFAALPWLILLPALSSFWDPWCLQ